MYGPVGLPPTLSRVFAITITIARNLLRKAHYLLNSSMHSIIQLYQHRNEVSAGSATCVGIHWSRSLVIDYHKETHVHLKMQSEGKGKEKKGV